MQACRTMLYRLLQAPALQVSDGCILAAQALPPGCAQTQSHTHCYLTAALSAKVYANDFLLPVLPMTDGAGRQTVYPWLQCMMDACICQCTYDSTSQTCRHDTAVQPCAPPFLSHQLTTWQSCFRLPSCKAQSSNETQDSSSRSGTIRASFP